MYIHSTVCKQMFNSKQNYSCCVQRMSLGSLKMLSTKCICKDLVGRVFTYGPGDLGSIPCRVIPKTLKIVHDTSLFNTQQYKVRIKGREEQSRERSSALSNTSL